MRSRISFACFTTLVTLISATGCDVQGDTTAIDEPLDPIFAAVPDRGLVVAAGGGHFDAGVIVQFGFNAVQKNAAGDATGHLKFTTVLGGLPIEFHGRVTCMTADLENRRAWVGGVVTRIDSEHPSFTGDIHQVGRDIWFRVVDYGEGAGAAQVDRTTFVGFEGSADIITSPEYCETQPWPDNDERTSPLTDGNVKING